MLTGIVTMIVMLKSKEFHTLPYFIVANHCAVDIFSLTSVGYYVASAFISQKVLNEHLERVMGFVGDYGWYTSGSFLILFAFTRMLKLHFTEASFRIITRRFIVLCSLSIYLLYALLCGTHLFSKTASVHSCMNFSTWCYDLDTDFGQLMDKFSYLYDIVCPLILITINAITIHYVHKTGNLAIGNQLHRISLRQKEIKLFAQCLIGSTFFCLTCLIYFLSNYVENTTCILGVIMHINWVLNHANSPVVYFIFNGAIQQSIKKFLIRG
uniref:Vomeronasal type-1 receptor n=1 Tax=Romanomermis culicivorax TaxID=13658 RepID=A0A915K9U9_ROMCU